MNCVEVKLVYTMDENDLVASFLYIIVVHYDVVSMFQASAFQFL